MSKASSRDHEDRRRPHIGRAPGVIVIVPSTRPRCHPAVTRRRDTIADLVMGWCDEAGGPLPTPVAIRAVAGALDLPRAAAVAELNAVVADGRLSRGNVRGERVVWPTLATPAL